MDQETPAVQGARRKIYPLEITGFEDLIANAKARTGIKNQALLLKLAIERGLPILEKQLASHRVAPKLSEVAGE